MTEPAPSRGCLRVLYGSETGCAEEVAQRIVAEAVRQRYEVKCCSMDEYDVQMLPVERLVIFVASTTGEGEVPENMRAFWRFMLRRDLPAKSLSRLSHACFGLGDSSYPKFNFAIKRLHRRLEQLGSAAVLSAGLGDDQDALGVDHALGPWLSSLWQALDVRMPLPAGVYARPLAERPRPRYTLHVNAAPGPDEQAKKGMVDTRTAAPTSADGPPLAASRTNPFAATVVRNDLLTKPGCGREVRHIELDVSGWGLRYAEGDALAVRPSNPVEATRALVMALGFEPDATVRVSSQQPHAPALPQTEWSVLELFTKHLDVFGVPRRPFFALLAHFATKPMDEERLNEFAVAEGASDLAEYATRPRRTYAEVLLDFASARPPLEYYLDLIPPLRPRYFSISSSPSVDADRVHITVAVVKYQTYLAAPRYGVCSNFLARCAPWPAGLERHAASSDLLDAHTVPVWLRKGCLVMPTSSAAPIIMIGPGTGVAPFRAFVHARQAQRAAGQSVGPTVLFFGCRRPDHDFLYADEWREYERSGTLDALHVAFSRVPDQPKVYVQHLMVQPAVAARLWELLLRPDAHVYIAGAANQMPKAVRTALQRIAQGEGGMDEASAAAFVKQLEATKRLQCETW